MQRYIQKGTGAFAPVPFLRRLKFACGNDIILSNQTGNGVPFGDTITFRNDGKETKV